MADAAKRRVQALGNQIAPPTTSSSSPESQSQGLPAIRKVAGESAGPRARGKVVIVTGANSPLGIGRASAHQFAENGARAVYVCDRDESHLAAHKREMEARWPGVEVHARRFDAADEEAVRGVVEDAVGRYGRLDVFFANAGVVGRYAMFTDVRKEEFMRVLDTNVASVFLAAKYAAPAMQKTSPSKPTPSGSIICTASVAGLRSNAGTAPYAASKAAVISLAQNIAYQLAGTNVRVNAICPGLIETGMTAPTFETARARGTEKKIGQLNPLKRGGLADEVARVALFLGSDEASYVNGQAWAVDGGLSAGHPFVLGKMA
ncbi:NAD(P)-binding protein [Hypoxylon sp. FL0543]|nr:NAD(P)-binding protein [Hypoxylon sp. FL0543]